MSTQSGSGLSNKNDSMLTVVALLLGLVAGIMAYQMGGKKEILVIVGMMILVFGLYYLITMPFVSNKSEFLPAQRTFRLVWGALLTTVGALLLINIYNGLDLWVMLVILLLVVVLVILYIFMNKREG